MAKPKPPEKPAVRDARVVCYFTPQDADNLTEIARKLGLSRSALVVAVMERLLIGGFSIRVAAQLMAQIQRRAKERGADPSPGLYFGLRPLPPLPSEDLTAEDDRMVLESLKNMKPC